MKRKAVSTAITAVIELLFDVILYNEHWLAGLIKGRPDGYEFSFKRLLLYIVIAVLVFFFSDIKKYITVLLKKLEQKPAFQNNKPDVPKNLIGRVFIFLALIFGITMIMVVPPLNAPDEQAHFAHAYLLSRGDIIPHVVNKDVIGYADKSLGDYMQVWPGVNGQPNKKVNFQKYYASFGDELVAKGDVPIKYYTASTNPVLYLPQAAGIFTGRIIFDILQLHNHYNYNFQLLFARLFNLLYYILMISLALRLTPVFKRTIAILCLMPMTIFQAASASYDVFVITACVLFIAAVLKYAYDPDVKQLKIQDFALLAVLAAFVFLSKEAYIPLVLMILIIPAEKFKGMKIKMGVFIFALVFAGIIFAAWSHCIKVVTAGSLPEIDPKYAAAQVQLILHHPYQFFFVLLNSLKICGRIYIISFVAYLGWMDVWFPLGFAYAFCVYLILSAVLEPFKAKLSVIKRLLSAAVFVACVVLVLTGIYVTWTSRPDIGGVGYFIAQGVQGRYFIPCAACLLFAVANGLTEKYGALKKLGRYYDMSVPILMILTLSYAIVKLVLRYYI